MAMEINDFFKRCMQQVILKAKEENAKKETGTYLDLQV